jgi:demethylmacrocin O-methyltransferase
MSETYDALWGQSVGLKTLDQIATKHGTDKATSHPIVGDGKGHGYTPHYAAQFDAIRSDPIKLFEIGVGGGESIRTWLEYFDNARVFGVDNVQGTNPWNTVGAGTHLRYTFVSGDQSCETFWKCFVADYGSNWGVIVDDGSHLSKDVITTFNAMWPHVAPGGFYCIEDLGCSYGAGSVHCKAGCPTHMDFIASLMDDINLKDGIASLHFSKELAIFRKAKS